MSKILCGDAVEQLRTLADGSVNMCVTSPPYYGFRDYGESGQIGIEQTPDEYIARLVEVFDEVKRVLAKDGTLWLNIADSYAGSGKGPMTISQRGKNKDVFNMENRVYEVPKKWSGIKPKDLIGIPWLLAFALRERGWYLRSDIIWHKLNCLPESVKDRPTKTYEHIFLLSKSPKYYYDYKAIQEPLKQVSIERYKRGRSADGKYVGTEANATSNTGASNQPLITVGMLERLNGDEKGDVIVSVRGYEPIWAKFTPSYELKDVYFAAGKASISKREARLFEKQNYVFDIMGEGNDETEKIIEAIERREQKEQEDEREKKKKRLEQLDKEWDKIQSDIIKRVEQCAYFLNGKHAKALKAASLENKVPLLYSLMEEYGQTEAQKIQNTADFISKELPKLIDLQEQAKK